MSYQVGHTDSYSFIVKKAGANYDPPVVQVSFLNTKTGVEDVLTYGGSDIRDEQVTRSAVGSYAWWYRFSEVGEWHIKERWLDAGGTVEVKPNRGLVIVIEEDEHKWTDTVAP